MNEYILIILETMYSAIEHSVNMALYKCCILLLLLITNVCYAQEIVAYTGLTVCFENSAKCQAVHR